MERKVGTISRGIRCPIIRQGDDLPAIVTRAVLDAAQSEGFSLRDRDVVAVTESVVARSQGNYASVQDMAADVRAKLGGETVGVALGAKKVVLMLSYPSDEVGNCLVSLDKLDEAGIDPYTDTLTLAEYREKFGENRHEFTGIDYVGYYEQVIREAGAEAEIIFSNQAKTILNYTKNVLVCDIHTRARTKRILRAAGAERVCGLADEDTVKLFPRDCGAFVRETQKRLMEATGKHIEVMVYGDGAFKDPQGKIWELADPCVSPAYTDGLVGTPNELKLKYLADNDFGDDRQHGFRGNHAAPAHRPHRLPVRPDQRLRRQGNAHRSGAGLFRQLLQQLNMNSKPPGNGSPFPGGFVDSSPGRILRYQCP